MGDSYLTRCLSVFKKAEALLATFSQPASVGFGLVGNISVQSKTN